ncbi:FeoA family protein [Maribellus maritimus]|uniref:FeoA family protein n=1 Tax=Maribellus maritimus TaxID=2870838 RepID=UPI001EEACEB4|nr:FeoA family protein [Maribellus maritimus]MCG6186366.1 ferrous iron transport protein A [Maribellus maritimus]
MKETIVQLKRGEKGIIKEFSTEAIPLKFQEVGCLPGNEVRLIQFSPFKDLVYLTVNDSHFAIRTETAALIEISRIK